jgi:MFS family permease
MQAVKSMSGEVGVAATVPAATSPVAMRAVYASTVGSVLEWVDFAAYGAVAATVFPVLFFSSMDPGTAILAAFATFGVGFFARPFGGLFFGMLGDRIGRKNVLLYTLCLMGATSFLIGCLPTYAQVGILAPLALVALRFAQGFALGGEATGAQLMTMEHAPPDKRGLYGAFINTGSSVSAALTNAMLFVLTGSMGAQAFTAWGWRVPFLCSFLLVIVGVYIRLRVAETPAFLEMRKSGPRVRSPMVQAFREQPITIMRLIVVWCAPCVCFYVVNVFGLTYITKTLGMSSSRTFLCLLIANVVAVFAVVLGGLCSDRFGRKRTMIVASVLMLLAALAFFPLLATRHWFAILFAITACVASIQIQSGVQPALFAEPFPTHIRYSGSAAAYTGANLIASGPTPFVAAWLFQHSGGQTWAITIMCVAVIVCALVATALGPETRGTDMFRS